MLSFELRSFFSLTSSLSKGSSECVQLLIDVGANLEAHDCHFGTPLHVACAREHLDCAKLLLKAGMAATGFASGWAGDGGVCARHFPRCPAVASLSKSLFIHSII